MTELNFNKEQLSDDEELLELVFKLEQRLHEVKEELGLNEIDKKYEEWLYAGEGNK